ncbi:MAG: hypothetical protein LBT47_08145 [Deltaproteobacteria bacterium]|nr:hypothetical protein [Deltaproteobacteria bacterium]
MTNFLRNKFPVIILSLILSFLFWLRVSGQNTSTHDLSFSLVFNELPSNVALDDNIPDAINVRVEANTAQAKIFTDRRPVLRLDFSDVVAGSNRKPIDREAISQLLPRGVHISRITPEELVFEAYGFIEKTVPVKVPEQGTLKTFLERKGTLKVDPPEAILIGPSNRLENIAELSTSPFVWDYVNGPGVTLVLRAQASGLDTWLTVRPVEFKVTPEVEIKYKNLTFDVPVKLSDSASFGPEAQNVVFRPQEVAVSVQWPMNLPDPPLGSDGGITVTVTVDPATLKRRKSLPVVVESANANQAIRITGTNPARITVSWVAPPPKEPQAGEAVAPVSSVPAPASPAPEAASQERPEENSRTPSSDRLDGGPH